MTRRVTKLVVVYLLLGLVTTWAVAWGSALLWRPTSVTPGLFVEVGPAPHRMVYIRRCPAGRSIAFNGTLASEGDLRAYKQHVEHWDEDIRPIFDVLRFRLAPSFDWIDEPDAARAEMAVVARGWPWLALKCGLWLRFSSSQCEVHHAIAITNSGPAADEWANAILLPYLPYWPGLIADTLFYALLLASLHQLAAWGRRARRRRRGRCVGCGYDLTGIDGVCPECGGPRT